MRILFFSHYYAPEVNAPASRTAEHCRAWAAAGHDVTVVTSAPNHPQGRVYPGYRNRWFQTEAVGGVRVVRIWTLLAANEGFARRILSYLSYLVSAVLTLPRLPGADVIVSTSPQFFCGLVGLFAGPFKRAPWTLEIRDLWPESIVAVGAMRKGRAIRCLEWLEAFAYRRADAVVSLTRSFVPHIVERRGTAIGVVVLSNATDLAAFVKGDGDAVRRALGLEGKFVGAYVGTHGVAHGLTTILDAAEILKDDPRFAFLMVGDGAERARLEEARAGRGLHNVLILGQRPKSEMPGIWSATDASLILLKRSDAFKKVLPSKMMEAMAMRCPIILGVEGEAREALDEANAGVAIPPEDAGALATAMRSLADDSERAAAYGEAGRAYAVVHFDRGEVAARYLRFLEDLAARRPSREVSPPRPGQVGSRMSDAIGRLRRSIAFARHVPPRQALRRVALSARRRWRDQFGAPAANVDATPAPAPPAPIFAPRSGMIESSPHGIAFTFLRRTVAMAPGAIEWGTPSRAPEHQLWRMNLHYMEYLEEAGDALFAALIEDWIRANPSTRAGAWKDSWNVYALSIRAVVWMQQLALRGERIAESTRTRAAASLAAQLAYLESELETDIGGNHLVKNLKALLWGSAFFHGAEAERWRRIGLRLLSAALDGQILSDGVHFERSPSYHAQVFADLLECRHVLGPEDAPSALDSRLRAIAQATADLAHPDGLAAQFNDAGLHMAYPPRACLDAFAVLSGEHATPRACFAFPEAGYFGLRRGNTFFIADCGPIGPDALPAHAHGDILSFEWSVAGERLIVDPGVFEYVAGPRRAGARSAATHNTLCYDGLDQADFFGAFRCGRRPKAAVLSFDADHSHLALAGAHDGFGDGARHERRFEVEHGRLRILDAFDAPPGHAARLGFLLHPEAAVSRWGDGFLIARRGARVEFNCDAAMTLEDAVWWPDMGVELPTRRIRVAPDAAQRRVVTTFTLRTEEGYDKPAQAPFVRSPEAS